MSISSPYSRSGAAGQAATPAGNSRVVTSKSFGRLPSTYWSDYTGISSWRYYADRNGNVTSPPDYPDVSYGAYLHDGGNPLGIGYSSWKDARLAAYNTAYNMYQQWYDSTAQQVARINAAGLNTNLAYGMATPGSSPGGARAESSGQTPGEVFMQGASIISSMFGNIKTLAEAADIVNKLPESRFKGKVAKQLDVALAAGSINAENGFLSQLNSAREVLGVGTSKAQKESAENAFQTASQAAQKSLLDYMTSHDAEGSESDFDSSLYSQSGIAGRKKDIVEYQKVQAEWSNLLSNPEYYSATLQKLVSEGYISYSQAWQAKKILDDPNMDDRAKFMALQPGLPGFFAKATFSITSELVDMWNNIKAGFRSLNIPNWFK